VHGVNNKAQIKNNGDNILCTAVSHDHQQASNKKPIITLSAAFGKLDSLPTQYEPEG
jgi:hypothetical protein